MMKEADSCTDPDLIPSSENVLHKILSEISEIKTCMNGRLANLELKVAVLVQTCNKIAIELAKKNEEPIKTEKKAPIEEKTSPPGPLGLQVVPNKQSHVIPLSKESDYPNGCWLGNPTDSLRRVRCPILPINLTKINARSKNAANMTLNLINHLFTKEELSVSNISGRSRIGKKQLNPLFIFGVKCHLEYIFSITTKDWLTICKNIDAKCRFTARQNNTKMFMGNKKKQLEPLKESKECETGEPSQGINFYYESIGDAGIDVGTFKEISETPCELGIIGATPSQIDQLQQSHEVILEEILPSSSESKALLIKDDSLALKANLATTAAPATLNEPMEDVSMDISDDEKVT